MLHLLQPAESNGQQQKNNDSFINSDFCQVHTPHPLYEHLERFLHLVRDIETRKDEYSSQLSALTLAGMTADSNVKKETKSVLISDILTPKELREDKLKLQEEQILWQARLVLAIAEFLDREEEEVALAMATLEQEEENLYATLKGEDSNQAMEENPFSEIRRFEAKLGSDNRQRFVHRFDHWKLLCNNSSFGAETLFVTNSSDAADQLIKEYERQTGKEHLTVKGPTLPYLIDFEEETALQNIKNFHHDNWKLLQQLHGHLINWLDTTFTNNSDQTQFLSFKNLCEQWENLLESTYPKSHFGRNNTLIYIFPRTPCMALTGKEKGVNGQNNGILVLIE